MDTHKNHHKHKLRRWFLLTKFWETIKTNNNAEGENNTCLVVYITHTREGKNNKKKVSEILFVFVFWFCTEEDNNNNKKTPSVFYYVSSE